MLHENVSDFSAIRFRSRFTGRESFFADHVVHGHAILSGAAGLELGRAAVAQALSTAEHEHQRQMPIALTNVAWIAPITARDNVTVTVDVARGQDGDSVTFEIASSDRVGEPPTLKVRGAAVRLDERPAPTLNLEQWRGTPHRRLEHDDIYHRFTTRHIDYGPTHRGLRSIQLSGATDDVAVLAEIETRVVEEDGWGLHPSVVDAAFQSVLGFDLEGNVPAAIPFTLERIAVHGPTPPRAFALTRCVARDLAGTDSFTLEISIAAADGRVCAAISGLTTKVPPESADGRAETACFVPRWRPLLDGPGRPTLRAARGHRLRRRAIRRGPKWSQISRDRQRLVCRSCRYPRDARRRPGPGGAAAGASCCAFVPAGRGASDRHSRSGHGALRAAAHGPPRKSVVHGASGAH